MFFFSGFTVTYLCMVGLFYNGTNGNLSCFDIKSEFIECADVTGCGTGPAAISWDYQVSSSTDTSTYDYMWYAHDVL